MNGRQLTPSTAEMVGRNKEIERLTTYLHNRGDNNFLYYWAQGGLGKTRLLEELERLVEKAGEGYRSTGIIDLYHTDVHSTSDVERAIVTGLDPKAEHFPRYWHERRRYELLRERGTDPGILERYRENLSQIFIDECRQLSLDVRKLVISFDTVELLQYESSVVEETANLDTVDTQIKPWLLDKLSQLRNVLVVFAGRPKVPLAGAQVDLHRRLMEDMTEAFGEDQLDVVELKPFKLHETRDFIDVISEGEEVIPEDDLPVVHALTGGRPIFLHLVVDLIRTLSPAPASILELFDQYRDLVDAPEGDGRLEEVQQRVEIEILRTVFNETEQFQGLLGRIALMPKGVDAEILHQTLGVTRSEAEELIARLEPLSFTKRHKPPKGSERLHAQHLFLHDEMYHLLTKPGVIPDLRLNERMLAQSLERSYYTPRIDDLEEELETLPPKERVDLRERLQKLQVERLYYLLARDPVRGYPEFKRLSDEANRRRWVGYSMRLRSEFLRFYNKPDRREQFKEAGIPPEQVIRESAEMWVERFHWWGQYERNIAFASQILERPEDFEIRPEKDQALLANITALWVRDQTILHGYEPSVAEEALKALESLPPLSDCSETELMARARLSTSIGFQLRNGGLLVQAARHYVEAKAAFRKLGQHPDELAMLLNNLAFTYAKQGRMELARPLAHEALVINEEMGNDYSTGLTLSTLSGIARMRGSYSKALKYANEALDHFHELEDAHGTVLAYEGIAQATRRNAKHEYEKGRRGSIEQIEQTLQEALEIADRGMEVAREADLGAEVATLLSEQGRAHRDLGHVFMELEDREEMMGHYGRARRKLEEALEHKLDPVNRADILEDLAEVLFFSGDEEGAKEKMTDIEELIGDEYLIRPEKEAPPDHLPPEYFAPLGKVEMLRGQIAFEHDEREKGIEHYVLAYAYFARFSPDAVEKDMLLDYLYKRLRELPVDRQKALMDTLRERTAEYQTGVDVESFIRDLEDLLGV